jgi:hypothetical protein
VDSGRFSEDQAMDLDIPEQERRIKYRNQEKIVAQILYLPKNYICFRLFYKNPFLETCLTSRCLKLEMHFRLPGGQAFSPDGSISYIYLTEVFYSVGHLT